MNVFVCKDCNNTKTIENMTQDKRRNNKCKQCVNQYHTVYMNK